MKREQDREGMLSPYRVLDLADEKGIYCGKLFADLGADVIKIERPGGDATRKIGPFYHDEPDPEKSLFWFAFNTNKRGITLNIETEDGKEVFRRLVKTADFVVESFPPGYMDELGLGYSELEKVNPGIIMVSISPFGQTGPYKDYKAPDIVATGMGGKSYWVGDGDRAPLRMSHHFPSYLYASCEAMKGALLSLYYRNIANKGQFVDVSIQTSVVPSSYMLLSPWDLTKTFRGRGGRILSTYSESTKIWECKDGYVCWLYYGGPRASHFNLPLVKWMDEEGMATEFLKRYNWETFEWSTVTQEDTQRIEEPTRKFFLSHTKKVLMDGAINRRMMLAPVFTTAEILEDKQLASREFWVELEHPDLGSSITYPGAFVHASECPPQIEYCAPGIGQHNYEIYVEEMGLSRDTLVVLKQASVI